MQNCLFLCKAGDIAENVHRCVYLALEPFPRTHI
nr:MAG TPA: hypothetical protein [Caudoviricetes sp.]